MSLGGSNLKTEEQIQKLVHKVVASGVYSPNMNIPQKNEWNGVQEGTVADFLSMREGDHIYFFCKRKVYGIGKLIKVAGDCIHLNFPNADFPLAKNYQDLKGEAILNKSAFNLGNRFLCTFTGSPHFFERGVDMDDLLASNPQAFKMLRVFSKLTFIKVDDEEDKAIFNMLLKENEKYLDGIEGVIPVNSSIQSRIELIRDKRYDLTAKEVLKLAYKKGQIAHEKAIEAAIMEMLRNKENDSLLNSWDYISRQVIASPFKSPEYIDKMDIFGYKYIKGYSPAISKFLLIEVKRDIAKKDVIHQAMKYVDWIKDEYSYGDYNQIEAYIIAKKFPQEVLEEKRVYATRTYLKGRRPPVTVKWDNLKLIEYEYDLEKGLLLRDAEE